MANMYNEISSSGKQAAPKTNTPVASGSVDGKNEVAEPKKTTVKDYIYNDLNAAKKYIREDCRKKIIDIVLREGANVLKNLVDIIILGKTTGNVLGSGTSQNNTPYHSYYERPVNRATSTPNIIYLNMLDYDRVSFATADEAHNVLNEMDKALHYYDYVTVTTFFDNAIKGAKSIEPQANRFGWNDIRSVAVMQRSDGRYILTLPKPVAIN